MVAPRVENSACIYFYFFIYKLIHSTQEQMRDLIVSSHNQLKIEKFLSSSNEWRSLLKTRRKNSMVNKYIVIGCSKIEQTVNVTNVY